MSATLTQTASEKLVDLAKAQIAYERAKTQAAKRKRTRDELLAANLHRLPLGEWLTRGAYRLKRGEAGGGQRFSLGAYLGAGHHLTDEMGAHVTRGDRYPTLEVKPAK